MILLLSFSNSLAARSNSRAKLSDYKRDSTPPRNGALENFAAATTLGIILRNWEEALADYFKAEPRN
jgi:dTDP-4-dehydrorhamnose reductase